MTLDGTEQYIYVLYSHIVALAMFPPAERLPKQSHVLTVSLLSQKEDKCEQMATCSPERAIPHIACES